MKAKSSNNPEFFHRMAELVAIANAGVRNALEENRRRRIPIVFSLLGKIYYRLPDGTITHKSPFKG